MIRYKEFEVSRLSSTITRPWQTAINGRRRWATHLLEFGLFGLALWFIGLGLVFLRSR